MVWQAIEQAIKAATGSAFQIEAQQAVSGGSISGSCVVMGKLKGSNSQFFVKRNRADLLPMFIAESAGLQEIQASDSVRAPLPLCYGSTASESFLVLEYVEFGPATAQSAATLGSQLATMHRHSAAHFGWEQDNTIGSTAQINAKANDWAGFFRDHRLGYQLALAQDNGADSGLVDAGQRLLEQLPAFFQTYQPLPSLLHGDLWGGNWATDTSGAPLVFDPAVYYGDREADLAMTELFGGFDERFYHSYRHAWPWDAGYETRKVLYNLYHILNHFNLFGASYAAQALDMTNRLVAEAS